MCSQTFYKKIEHKRKAAGASLAGNSPAAVAVDSDRDGDSDGDGDGEDARGVENRRYIKELLVTHPLWKDGNFWEQVLWQCAIEQVRNLVPLSFPNVD